MPFNRRTFLSEGAGIAVGLLLEFYLPVSGRTRQRAVAEGDVFAPNAWLRIAPDNRITILAEKPELGQGAWTYTAMLVAEELEIDCSAVRIEQAPTIPAIYKGLHTGGSGGVVSSFTPLRNVGAQAREMLRAAAAARWRAPLQDCLAQNGMIEHTPTKRRLSYGELAHAAARLPASDFAKTGLKAPVDFRVIGRSVPRVDLPAKICGCARFGIDVRVPGMRYALIARCPYFGGRLIDCDDSAARATPGVRAVFPIAPLPRRYNTAGGVAVVADSTWAAIRGRQALVLQWAKAASRGECSKHLHRIAEERAAAPAAYVAVDRGDTPAALGEAAERIEAVYESPFQAHATMEPMNTTVHVRDDAIEVWSPTQFADEVQAEIAALSGYPRARVVVHTTFSGGSFGRRYQWDYAAEAWQVAHEVRAPVQLLFTREDDMQHDFYRPYNYQRLIAGIDPSGRISCWHTRIVTTPIAATNLYTGETESPKKLRDAATIAALEWYGADAKPYAIPNLRIDYVPIDSSVPCSWWRSVSSSYTAFAKECFIDELAGRARADPLQFRMQLISGRESASRRVRRVLEIAADKAGWGRPLPAGCGRGVACRSGDSVSAQVAEVAVDAGGGVRVTRVVSVVDCGIAVNPDGVRAMTEGAINFALTAVLFGEITIEDGRVEQSNFHDYRVLRLNEAPEIEVHVVPSLENPAGVGELGATLIGPAVANAIFAATGVRIRRLPIDRKLLAHS